MRSPILLASAALVGFFAVLALMLGTSTGNDLTSVFAGGPTATPKPADDGNLSGVYDVLVHPSNKAVGLFHCKVRIDHDASTDDAKAAAICYIDTPGLAPGSPLVDTADGLPGAPPPPPYTTVAPQKLNGSFSGGTLTLTGCFSNIGGALGPNTNVSLTIPNAKTGLPNLEGTVDIYANQSIAQCDSKTPSGDPILSPAVNLDRIDEPGGGYDVDSDSDGCPDGDELDKPVPTGKCGDDPYNPYDSDTSLDGPFVVTATATRADWDKTEGRLIPGTYFYCIGDLTQTVNDLDGNVMCYQDSPSVTGAAGSATPTYAVGLPGAPSPPPFTTGTPSTVTGSINKTTNEATLTGCFENVGGVLGPNIITVSTTNVQTGQGTVDIHANQSNADCASLSPVGSPDLGGVLLETAEQDPGFDHDDDGCSDEDELAKPPAGKCGDDPYNPLDSDSDFGGTAHVLVTATAADWDTGSDVLIPGSYFHCAASIVHNPDNSLDVTPLCYVDSTIIPVNPENAPGEFGDGLADTPPPLPLADVDDPHQSLSGLYDKVDNELQISGCFQNVEGPLGPNVYVETDGGLAGNSVADHIDAHTGQGIIDIYTQETLANCTAGTPAGGAPIPDAGIELAEQASYATGSPTPFDTDQDGCSDDQELQSGTGTVGSGGLRDPYNYWDFRDVPAGTPPTRDGAVFGGDIAAVVSVFGEVEGDSPASSTDDPVNTPIPAGLYHPAYDVSGSLSGSAGSWNTAKPDGGIFGTDISAVVAQFGDSC